MPLDSAIEFYKGASDIPIAILALFFAYAIWHKNHKTKWGLFFLGLGVCALIGAAAHMIILSPTVKKIVWTVLYAMMYETVRALIICLTEYITLEDISISRPVLITEGALFLISIILLYCQSEYDIYVFVAFCVFAIACIVKPALKNELPIKVFHFLLFGAFAIFFQAIKKYFAYGVVLGHGFILVAICILFVIALED